MFRIVALTRQVDSVRATKGATGSTAFHVLSWPDLINRIYPTVSFAMRPISISRCDTFVTMVEAAEFWNFRDRAVLRDLTLDWALLFECKMRSQTDETLSRLTSAPTMQPSGTGSGLKGL